MNVFSYLCPSQYPFFIPQSFLNAFAVESGSLSQNPFSSNFLELSIFGSKNRVLFSLKDPLPHSFILKTSHSNKVVEASDPSPNGDAQYLVAEVSNLVSRFQEKKYLAIKTADCLPIVFCFCNSNVFAGAICHAGWRGLSTQILQNTIEVLIQKVAVFDISRVELLASLNMFIAPAIFGVSYECGEDVQAALHYHQEITFSKYRCDNKLYTSLFALCSNLKNDSLLLPYLFGQNSAGSLKVYPDLQLLAALEGVVIGLNHNNINILRENTYAHPTLFSFRQATHNKIKRVAHQWTHLSFNEE